MTDQHQNETKNKLPSSGPRHTPPPTGQRETWQKATKNTKGLKSKLLNLVLYADKMAFNAEKKQLDDTQKEDVKISFKREADKVRNEIAGIIAPLPDDECRWYQNICELVSVHLQTSLMHGQEGFFDYLYPGDIRYLYGEIVNFAERIRELKASQRTQGIETDLAGEQKNDIGTKAGQQENKEESGLPRRILEIQRELRQFDNKTLKPGTDEYEKFKALHNEYQSEFSKYPIASFETPEELRELLIGLEMDMNNGVKSPCERAGEIYREAREYARLLRKKNPSLPSLPKPVENDPLMNWQMIIEWCDDAEEQNKKNKPKSEIKELSEEKKFAFQLQSKGYAQKTIALKLKDKFPKGKFYQSKVSRMLNPRK